MTLVILSLNRVIADTYMLRHTWLESWLADEPSAQKIEPLIVSSISSTFHKHRACSLGVAF